MPHALLESYNQGHYVESCLAKCNQALSLKAKTKGLTGIKFIQLDQQPVELSPPSDLVSISRKPCFSVSSIRTEEALVFVINKIFMLRPLL